MKPLVADVLGIDTFIWAYNGSVIVYCALPSQNG